jgi:hypothetical protein
LTLLNLVLRDCIREEKTVPFAIAVPGTAEVFALAATRDARCGNIVRTLIVRPDDNKARIVPSEVRRPGRGQWRKQQVHFFGKISLAH